jgi:fructokinase
MNLVGIELGGTKCICTLGTQSGEILASVSLPTGSNADHTLNEIKASLRALIAKQAQSSAGFQPAALGIASFGPLDLNPASPNYGSITATPKPGWSQTPILRPLGAELNVPTLITTDVNGAALAEGQWGAAQGLSNFIYVTIGTGIGAGIVSNGHLLQGLTHPEIGHMRIPVARTSDEQASVWAGSCSFHGDCLEGLASGTAIEARTGQSARTLPQDHPVWEVVAKALAHMCHNLTLTLAPQRILLGGGIMMGHAHLVERIRREFLLSLNDYANLTQLIGDEAQFIQLAGLGDRAGPLGSLALAKAALQGSNPAS